MHYRRSHRRQNGSRCLKLEGFDQPIKLDCGASCNVLPEAVFSRIPHQRRRLRPGPRVKGYKSWLNVLGVQTCRLKHRGKTWIVDFIVVDEPGQPAVLGLPSCKELDLVRRVHAISDTTAGELPTVVKKHQDVFEGLGKLQREHEIKLLPGATPSTPLAGFLFACATAWKSS